MPGTAPEALTGYRLCLLVREAGAWNHAGGMPGSPDGFSICKCRAPVSAAFG